MGNCCFRAPKGNHNEIILTTNLYQDTINNKEYDLKVKNKCPDSKISVFNYNDNTSVELNNHESGNAKKNNSFSDQDNFKNDNYDNVNKIILNSPSLKQKELLIIEDDEPELNFKEICISIFQEFNKNRVKPSKMINMLTNTIIENLSFPERTIMWSEKLFNLVYNNFENLDVSKDENKTLNNKLIEIIDYNFPKNCQSFILNCDLVFDPELAVTEMLQKSGKENLEHVLFSGFNLGAVVSRKEFKGKIYLVLVQLNN